MNTDKEVFEILSTSGLPGAKECWPEGGAPELPWFVYELVDDGMFGADDRNYANLPRYRASLYEKVRDIDVGNAFEAALAEFGPFTREEYHIDSEKCDMTTYTFTYTGGMQNG